MIIQLQKEAEQLQKEAEQLRQKFQAAIEQAKAAGEQNPLVTLEIETLTSEVNSLRKREAEHHEQVFSLRLKVTESEAKFEDATKVIDQMKNEAAALARKANCLEEENRSLNESYEQLKENLAKHSKNLSDATSTSTLEQEIENLRSQHRHQDVEVLRWQSHAQSLSRLLGNFLVSLQTSLGGSQQDLELGDDIQEAKKYVDLVEKRVRLTMEDLESSRLSEKKAREQHQQLATQLDETQKALKSELDSSFARAFDLVQQSETRAVIQDDLRDAPDELLDTLQETIEYILLHSPLQRTFADFTPFFRPSFSDSWRGKGQRERDSSNWENRNP